VVISITGIFGNILISRGNFAVLKREFPLALDWITFDIYWKT